MYTVRTVMPPIKETRDRRWDLRVAESEDALVRAASEQADTSFTGFIRGAAVSEARRVMADRTTFALEETDWRAVMELLDRPPQLPDGRRDLFSKPSVFE
jgi:uncharacterized protein (DUF1778 family)